MNAMTTNRGKASKRLGGRPSVAREVRQILDSRIEHKRNNNIVSAADWTTTGVVLPITQAIAQGDEIYQRSGDVIRPKRLTIRLQATGTMTPPYVGRIIVFKDLACQGSAPAVTDVLQSASYLSGWSAVNKQAHRFKILVDKEVIPVVLTNTTIVLKEYDLKLNGAVHYVSSTGASSNGIGSIFALFISSLAGAAGVYTYTWSYDTEYTDA